MEQAPQEKASSLRGSETLSPELAVTLREAVQKFSEAYKIRQAAGYDYKPSNAVDGNFALRMQYGQLREEIKRLGRRLDAGETLEADDYRTLVKKQAAFDRSYEKVKQYAVDNNIDINATNETGEESPTDTEEDAMITDNMESTHRSPGMGSEKAPMNMRPELVADMHESGSLDADEGQPRTPKVEAAAPAEAGLSYEVKQALLDTLATYESRVEAFRSKLTDTAVDSHPAYTEFKKRTQKLRSLLDGSWSEADTIVTQLVQSEQPRIDALYTELHNDLATQRQEFEASFGPEMTAVRDAMDAAPVDASKAENETDTPIKKTGWFDPAFRRDRGVEPQNAAATTADTKTSEPFQLTEDMRVDTDTTDEALAAVGEYPDSPDSVPEFTADWQRLATETAETKQVKDTTTTDTKSAGIGSYPDTDTAIPHFQQDWEKVAAEKSASNTELSTAAAERVSDNEQVTVLGQELPPSGPVGAEATQALNIAIGKMLLVMDKRSPGREKKAVHEAWGILHAVSPEQGLSAVQRQQLQALAESLPKDSIESVAAETKAWQELQNRLPSLSEKLQTSEESTLTKWRRRGKRILLAAAIVLGTATATNENDANGSNTTNSDLDTTPMTTMVDGLDAPEADSVDTIVPSATEAPELETTAPDQPVSGPGRTYESSVDTDNFGQSDNAIDSAPEYQAFTDSDIEQREALEAIPPMDRMLDTMLERQAIEYRFTPGSKIDTISEAMWDVWKQNADTLQVDSPVSKSQFLSTMWKVISDVEKQPAIHEALTQNMGIDSGDIHLIQAEDETDVSKRKVYNLLPLFQKMEAQLKEVSV